MSLLPPSDQQTLRATLAQMKTDVQLLFATQAIGCDTCPAARQILTELTMLSDRVAVEEINPVLEPDRAASYGISRVPALAILAAGQDTRIRFLGATEGYDFASLIDAVLLAGGARPHNLSAESLALVQGVSLPTTIQIFVTPT